MPCEPAILEQLETAFRAMGKRLVIRVEDITVAARRKSVRRQRRNSSASRSRHAAPDRSRRKKR